MQKNLIRVFVAAALTVPVAACGSSSPKASNTTTVSAAGSFNDADVEFAQGMIPHHEQAIEMADIALDPNVGASAAIKDLATRIKAGQDPEIAQMTALLKGWGKPIEMDMSDGHDMSSMPGMMSASEMKALGALTGADFDKNWAAMMIEHHEGAIVQAQTAKASAVNPDVIALADKIIAAQQGEITELKPIAG